MLIEESSMDDDKTTSDQGDAELRHTPEGAGPEEGTVESAPICEPIGEERLSEAPVPVDPEAICEPHGEELHREALVPVDPAPIADTTDEEVWQSVVARYSAGDPVEHERSGEASPVLQEAHELYADQEPPSAAPQIADGERSGTVPFSYEQVAKLISSIEVLADTDSAGIESTLSCSALGAQLLKELKERARGEATPAIAVNRTIVLEQLRLVQQLAPDYAVPPREPPDNYHPDSGTRRMEAVPQARHSEPPPQMRQSLVNAPINEAIARRYSPAPPLRRADQSAGSSYDAFLQRPINTSITARQHLMQTSKPAARPSKPFVRTPSHRVDSDPLDYILMFFAYILPLATVLGALVYYFMKK